MDEYQLGKDMQEIKDRLIHLESRVDGKRSGGCRMVSSVVSVIQAEREGREDFVSWKEAVFKDKTAGECNCRNETIRVYADGRYVDNASLFNDSGWPDNGDDHLGLIQIRAGESIIASWDWKVFVSRGHEVKHTTEGSSEEIRRHFDRIDGVRQVLGCD